jgi:hypothetical protein
VGDGGPEHRGVRGREPLRLREVESRDHLAAPHRREQPEPGLQDRSPVRERFRVIRPAQGQLRHRGEVQAHAQPDLDLALARAQDRPAAGLVDLDEPGEYAVRGTPRLVRHQDIDHRVQSVHGLDYSAKGVPQATNGWMPAEAEVPFVDSE